MADSRRFGLKRYHLQYTAIERVLTVRRYAESHSYNDAIHLPWAQDPTTESSHTRNIHSPFTDDKKGTKVKWLLMAWCWYQEKYLVTISSSDILEHLHFRGTCLRNSGS
jgi:hypothetical protein